MALRSKLLSTFFRPAHTWRQYTNSFGQKTLKWAPNSGGKLLNYSGLSSSHQPEDFTRSSHRTQKMSNPGVSVYSRTLSNQTSNVKPNVTKQVQLNYLPCFKKLDLSAAPFTETPTTNSAFLWYQSQRDVHLFCKFRMTSTWAITKM